MESGHTTRLLKTLEIGQEMSFTIDLYSKFESARISLYQNSGRRYKIKKIKDMGCYSIIRVSDRNYNFTHPNISYLRDALVLLQMAKTELKKGLLKDRIESFIASIKQ